MPLHKLGDDFDPDELDVEYEDGQFQSYDGEIPSTGTMVTARVTKMWLTASKDDDIMFKALLVAEDGEEMEDDVSEYDGLPIWENLTMVPSAAFRYQPFVAAFPFTLKEMKSKLYVSKDDDNIGAPVEKIGKWEPGSDEALCYVVIKKERYNGKWQAKIGEILPFEELEEEEPPPPPRRQPKANAKAAPARGRRRAEPEPDEDDELEEEEEKPRTRARAAANGRGSRKRTPAKAATRGRSRRAADDDEDEDEPPF